MEADAPAFKAGRTAREIMLRRQERTTRPEKDGTTDAFQPMPGKQRPSSLQSSRLGGCRDGLYARARIRLSAG